MKKHWRLWTVLLVVIAVIVATACRNRQVVSRLEADHGVAYEYYEMGDTVPFAEYLNGYSLRIDDAQVMTYEEFLDWAGVTEDEVAELLQGETGSLPEKLCLLSITFFNEDSDADGFYLDDFSLSSAAYDLYYDTTLTTLANSFLSWNDPTNIVEVLTVMQGIYLDQGSQAVVYLVYDYPRSPQFTSRHWARLDKDTLQFIVTWSPTEKLVTITLD